MSSTNNEWLTEVVDGGLTRREWIIIGSLGGAVFICLIVILVLLIIMARRRPRNHRDTHEFDENLHVWDHKGMNSQPRADRHQGDRHRNDRHHGDRQYEDKHHGERNHRDREHHSNGHVNQVSNDYGLAHYPPPSGGRYVERRYDDYVPRVHTQYY